MNYCCDSTRLSRAYEDSAARPLIVDGRLPSSWLKLALRVKHLDRALMVDGSEPFKSRLRATFRDLRFVKLEMVLGIAPLNAFSDSDSVLTHAPQDIA
jgi:hypothetical protein